MKSVKKPEKIMVVDDDPDILVSLRDIFEHEGYEVFTVDTGKDCIDEIEQGFSGIILIDIMMPFMDGWETIRQIIHRGLNKKVLISVITAKGTPNPKNIRGLEPYIYDYIAKPFDIDDLISVVSDIRYYAA